MKKYLMGILCVSWVSLCSAQDMFWSFDDAQNPLPIPAECDAKFDEIRGGVFMPSVDEMYEYGMAFIKNGALSVQQQGAYCLLGAALQGHPEAQLEMAKMYEEGRILPQDDLSAYKWAFIAALNGNKPAEKITLMLEQLLTTDDLDMTTAAIQETRMQIQQNLQQKLEEERRQAESDKAKLQEMHSEIRKQYTNQPEEVQEELAPDAPATLDGGGPTPEALQEDNAHLVGIFNENDRMQ